MIPKAGSAYSYGYAVLGEGVGRLIGCKLRVEELARHCGDVLQLGQIRLDVRALARATRPPPSAPWPPMRRPLRWDSRYLAAAR